MQFITQASVIRIIVHNEYVREFILNLEKERGYNPGSFVQLTLDEVTASDIWPESRTFSVASYEKGIMKFIIKKTGAYTIRIFNELTVGRKCTIKYPFGDLFNKKRIHEKHLFLAGGMGVTPYLGLVEFFKSIEKINNIHLLYSVKYLSDLIHYPELKKILGNNLEIFITREVREGCYCNRISLSDIRRVADKETNTYICGSKDFNDSFRQLLQINGYKNIFMDEWE